MMSTLPSGLSGQYTDNGFELKIDQCDKARPLVDILAYLSAQNTQHLKSCQSVRIVVDAHASATLILEDLSGHEKGADKGRYLLELGEGSQVDFIVIRNCEHCPVKKGHFDFLLGKNARLQVFTFVHDGLNIQDRYQVELEGEGCFADFKGLAVLKADQKNLTSVDMIHKASESISRQYFKNILSDRSESEFLTQVHVHSKARKSDSHQLSRHLLLSEQATGRSKPVLKIDNEDVACAHGATIGQLQQEELFYLKSRGIAEKDAKYILMYGFAEELLEKLSPESLKKQIEAVVEQELRQVLS